MSYHPPHTQTRVSPGQGRLSRGLVVGGGKGEERDKGAAIPQLDDVREHWRGSLCWGRIINVQFAHHLHNASRRFHLGSVSAATLIEWRPAPRPI